MPTGVYACMEENLEHVRDELKGLAVDNPSNGHRPNGKNFFPAAFTGETAKACQELVAIQTKMLAAMDPGARADEIDKAAARADDAVAQIDVQVDASTARINQLEQQLAEQAGASVARINELEQQLKAAKVVASDAGGDRLVELLAELVAASKETNARLKRIEEKPAAACCLIA